MNGNVHSAFRKDDIVAGKRPEVYIGFTYGAKWAQLAVKMGRWFAKNWYWEFNHCRFWRTGAGYLCASRERIRFDLLVASGTWS